ncbi:hypothetical protein [Rubritalea marina]|uniref:hypothetical protein n=1 Tax=Rubritalea marina TaxID=361055 RepID=UPI00037D81FF|nr:hypothetical protein [Rubritalea marina]
MDASQLTDSEKEQLAAWAAAGDQLQELQQKIQSELGHNITYLDTRFLVLDLGIELLTEAQPEEQAQEDSAPVRVPTGFVDASVDTVERPGALKSGSVTFSDGEPAVWIIDQSGRLSLDPETPGYQPNEEDMIKFQEKLRDLLT